MRRSRFILLGLTAVLLTLPSPAAASKALAVPGVPQGTGGDHPLKRFSVDQGHIDAFVTAIAYSNAANPSGTFTVSGLPANATIKRALLYLTDWDPTGSVFGAFGTGSYGPGAPFSLDGGSLTLGTYRFDVSPFVQGNGSYFYS